MVFGSSSGSSGRISFGGLASGMDTNSIISQLMAVAERPITLATNQQRKLEEKSAAIGKVASALSALQTRVQTLNTAKLSLDGHDVPVSALPETVALSSDGAWIATAGAVGGEVHVFGWDGATQMDVRVGGRPVRTVFSPDGSLVAVALSASSGVALVDRAGGVRMVEVVGTPDGLAFSLDGTRLYAADMAGGRITVVEVATRRVLAVMSVGRSAGSLMVLAPAR